MAITITVNGKRRSTNALPDTPLLYVLRDELHLHGPRFGCGLAQCGACSVLLDGKEIRSCVTPVAGVVDKPIVTIEGLGTPEKPHPLQKAFIAEQAAQCGFCTSGMMIMAADLLTRTPRPTEAEIKKWMNPHICRCGTHYRFVAAIQRASKEMAA
jgi:nicotinate dehydrogenase subunit A